MLAVWEDPLFVHGCLFLPFSPLPILAYAQDYGLSASQGANLVSVLSAFNFIGRVLSG
jgi:hypothetical protein